MPEGGAALELTRRVRSGFDFSAAAGPIADEVIGRVGSGLHDWRRSGTPALSLPFNGNAFRDVIEQAEADLRVLLAIPDNYRVLFMHGGATAQFAAVPLNLLRGWGRACYIDSGYWSGRAMAEARRYCAVEVAASSAATGYDRTPVLPPLQSDAAYCHIVANETAGGVQYRAFPTSAELPLVADMTSDFLTRPLDVSRFGAIYAGAQKNLGIAGLAVVVVREDLIGAANPLTPAILDYGLQAQHASRYNTPPTFAICLAGLVFRWLIDQGGLPAMEAAGRYKSDRVYAAIEDSAGFYCCPVLPSARSRVNPCFRLADDTLTPMFLAAAQCQGLFHLAGHPSVGGVRASLYNAMPEAGAEALAQFMTAFARRNG